MRTIFMLLLCGMFITFMSPALMVGSPIKTWEQFYAWIGISALISFLIVSLCSFLYVNLKKEKEI